MSPTSARNLRLPQRDPQIAAKAVRFEIQGKVRFKLWPMTEISIVERAIPADFKTTIIEKPGMSSRHGVYETIVP